MRNRELAKKAHASEGTQCLHALGRDAVAGYAHVWPLHSLEHDLILPRSWGGATSSPTQLGLGAAMMPFVSAVPFLESFLVGCVGIVMAAPLPHL